MGAGGDEPLGEAPQTKHVAVRAGVLGVAYIAFAPIVWLLFAGEAWLEERRLWLPACFAFMTLGTLPLRMAFAPPDREMGASGAARHYAARMLAVLGAAAGLFGAMTLASRITEDGVSAILIGLFFFLVPLLAVPAIVTAIRGRTPFVASLAAAAKGLGLALGIVIACAALVALRSKPAKRTILVPLDVQALLDPLDLERVRVGSRRVPDAQGLFVLHLSADAGDFMRTLKKLSTEVVVRVDALLREPNASGEIRLWLPARFDVPANRSAATEEERIVNNALGAARKITSTNRPARVAIAFGAAPTTTP